MFLSPVQIIESLNLKKGDVVADFGCGSGIFSFLASKKVGDRGKVFAIDIHKEILEKINRESDKMNIINIETILSHLEKQIEIESYSADYVILSNILSAVSDIDRLLEEAKRILKPNGIFLIIDWKETEHAISTKRGHIVKEEEIIAMLAKNNISVKKHLPAGRFHYAFLAM